MIRISSLLSSMTEDILQDVVEATTSQAAWDILKRVFSSAIRARAVQVRVDLATTKKRDLSATDYFHKIKSLAAELAASDAPLRTDEIIAYLLAGLPSGYDPFVTSITMKTEPPTLDDFYAHLLAFEARQLQSQEETRLNIGARTNFAGRGGPERGRDRGPPTAGRGARGRGGPPFQGRGHGAPSSTSIRPRCQICGLKSHTAIKC
jgi:hypothetical protein